MWAEVASHHLMTDTLVWVLFVRSLLCLTAAVLFWLDPVWCTLHTKHYHNIIAVGFGLAAYSSLDRALNRGISLVHGSPIPAWSLIDSELLYMVALFVLVAITAYDYWRNKERAKLHRSIECSRPKDSI